MNAKPNRGQLSDLTLGVTYPARFRLGSYFSI